jgi:hypothetical protein
MELNNEFRVGIPPTQAWGVLTDVERIAPCMPGAQLQEIEGDEYRGIVKVKVGPITAQYKGKATFLERDEEAGRLVLRAEGRDTRGQGNANATITATLVPDEGGTKVTVNTDLTVTGKVAQFGRGVLGEVSVKLLNQFVSCLETKVLASSGTSGGGPSGGEPSPAPAAGPAPAAAASTAPVAAETATIPDAAPAARPADAPVTGDNGSTSPRTAPRVRKIDSPEAPPVDLIDAAGGSLAKRAGPAVVGLMVLLLVVLGLRRRGRRRRSR